MVFLDDPDCMPLTPDARSAFEESVFLFDRSDYGFLEDLREFLALPHKTLQSLWERKAAARRRMIAQFISDPAPAAGARAADRILAMET
jgi:hypothetical protein